MTPPPLTWITPLDSRDDERDDERTCPDAGGIDPRGIPVPAERSHPFLWFALLVVICVPWWLGVAVVLEWLLRSG